jgi:hypothetical protein
MMNILMVQFLLLLLLAGYLHAGKFIPVNPQQLPSSGMEPLVITFRPFSVGTLTAEKF